MAAETQVIRATGGSGNEVVLGEDWVRPQSAVDSEVRIRRARRGILSIFRSPLARKIILFNMLALVLLVAGVLFTNPFRDTLARQHETALIAQAQGLADLMAVLPEIGGTEGYDDPQALDQRTDALSRLSLGPHTEILLLSADGTVETAQSGDQAPAPSADDDDRRTLISDTLDSIWGLLAGLSLSDGTQPEDAETLVAGLHEQAMTGTSASRVERLEGRFRMIVAAPVLVDGTAVGSVVMQQIPVEIDRMLRAEREQVLQMFLVALLVSVGLSLVLASTIANPLADLATAAELGRDRNARRMSPGRVRIPDLTGRPDEIGRLSAAMRGMVSALYDRIDANEQFAADVAHEIKNPLASLRSAVGTLRVAKRDDQIARLLDVVEHDVRRLDRLISDTSNASRLDSELVKEEEETFNLCKTLDNLSQHLAQEAQAKGVEFISELPREAIMIQGLEARLAQVFVNLISNAISFCQAGDAVRIWARKRENRVLVVVEDTGPGIPEQALSKVFKRFYSERPQDQFGNHSGLGLAISKQIIEAHGGVIWAENIRPTHADPNSPPLGARFVVGLPL
ncbi:MAG: two-component signal transduction ssytem histidine kinase ChvG [Rhodobacteraceae bacterium HLUCCA12]|nr:MAG: two-component signal transduction ssytem histidine kinase ChvG [Rhodobacteraceae bacterium HLUCCA12]